MNRQIAILTFLTLCACPQNDIGDTAADEVGSESTGSLVPDLPGTDSETSSTGESDTESGASTADSESTEDGGSTTDVDSESTSDDDIGDTGSEAVPTSLSVEADGQRIGYLMLVQDYGLYIWDDVNEVTFSVNQQTGHVVGGSGGYYYATSDCTGTQYSTSSVQIGICNQVPAPVRRSVIADSPFGGGHIAPTGLHTTAGDPTLVNVQSLRSGPDCIAYVTQICGLAYVSTDVIPQTFALPIIVVESAP
jgi:hypothetical protein